VRHREIALFLVQIAEDNASGVMYRTYPASMLVQKASFGKMVNNLINYRPQELKESQNKSPRIQILFAKKIWLGSFFVLP
jgi:hypothetical protein